MNATLTHEVDKSNVPKYTYMLYSYTDKLLLTAGLMTDGVIECWTGDRGPVPEVSSARRLDERNVSTPRSKIN